MKHTFLSELHASGAPRSHAPRGNALPATLRVAASLTQRPRVCRVSRACRWLALAALAAALLYAHGCHGDEDHELFGLVHQMLK